MAIGDMVQIKAGAGEDHGEEDEMTYFLACAIDGCQTPVTPNRERIPLGDFCDEHRAQVLAALDRDFPPESDSLVDDMMRFARKFLTRARG